jgi:hypothetical protein
LVEGRLEQRSAVALVGSYELLMMIIRSAQLPEELAAAPAEVDTSALVRSNDPAVHGSHRRVRR